MGENGRFASVNHCGAAEAIGTGCGLITAVFRTNIAMNQPFWIGVCPAPTDEMMDDVIGAFAAFFANKQ